MRFVVLDTRGDWAVTEVAGHRGSVLGEFRTLQSARALAVQRLAYGDRGVVVVTMPGGEIVYQPSREMPYPDASPGSGYRPRAGAEAPPEPAERSPKRGAG